MCAGDKSTTMPESESRFSSPPNPAPTSALPGSSSAIRSTSEVGDSARRATEPCSRRCAIPAASAPSRAGAVWRWHAPGSFFSCFGTDGHGFPLLHPQEPSSYPEIIHSLSTDIIPEVSLPARGFTADAGTFTISLLFVLQFQRVLVAEVAFALADRRPLLVLDAAPLVALVPLQRFTALIGTFRRTAGTSRASTDGRISRIDSPGFYR